MGNLEVKPKFLTFSYKLKIFIILFGSIALASSVTATSYYSDFCEPQLQAKDKSLQTLKRCLEQAADQQSLGGPAPSADDSCKDSVRLSKEKIEEFNNCQKHSLLKKD